MKKELQAPDRKIAEGALVSGTTPNFPWISGHWSERQGGGVYIHESPKPTYHYVVDNGFVMADVGFLDGQEWCAVVYSGTPLRLSDEEHFRRNFPGPEAARQWAMQKLAQLHNTKDNGDTP